MTREQKLEDKQNMTLQIRASLGRWQKDGMSITLLDRQIEPQADLRQYEVQEVRQAYKPAFKYNITMREVLAKIKTMQQTGYKLVAPQFPELKEFFRNGRPITAVDIFEDAINEIEVEKDDRNGLDFLMDTW